MNIFNTFSKAGVGTAIITILNVVFPLLGVELPEGAVAGAVEAVVQVVGFILLVYGQLDRKDLVAGIIRRG